MRGKVPDSAKKFTNSRITPAYAGKSYRFFVVACDDWDHPRLCGEKRRHALLSRKGSGSPPPMRGKGQARRTGHRGTGITPAYAGKSRPVRIRLHRWRDHPRLCGEKFCAAVIPSMLAGSPPPMRGKVVGTVDRILPPGITPAYAGKSYCL